MVPLHGRPDGGPAGGDGRPDGGPPGGGGRPDGVRVNRAKSNNGDCEVVSGSSLNSNTKNSGGSARLARVIAPVIIARSWWLE